MKNRKPLLWTAAVVMLLVAGGVIWEQARISGRLPAYLSARLSAALKRPVEVGKVSLWPPGAFSLRRLTVLPLPGETEPPLTARRVRVYISWWDLLAHGKLVVRSLQLDRAHLRVNIDLRETARNRLNPTEKLLSLYGLGLREIGLHKSDAVVTTIQADGSRLPMNAQKLEADATLHPNALDYRVGAGTWTGAGLVARDLLLQGSADSSAITVGRSRGSFQGGVLQAQGSYATRSGGVNMNVNVRELPLGKLATQLGIPSEWVVHGNLTGTMQVNAVSGTLQNVAGTLSVARGSIARSNAVFPWDRATAQVNLTRSGVTFRRIDIAGPGIRLLGDADVSGKADEPFPQRPFRASASVDATRTDAVANLARLLAFSTPVSGSWGLQHARVTFQASGIVGQLAQARANGHLTAQGLMLHPTASSPALLLHTVDGDVERTPNLLRLTHLTGAAEGISGTGNVAIYPKESGHAGTFVADGRLNLTSLATLHAQLPNANFWKWIEPTPPGAGGTVAFQAHGPAQRPAEMVAAGTFRLHELRASVPLSRTGPSWTVPIHQISGSIRVAQRHAELSNVRLASDLFQGGASLHVPNITRLTGVGGTVHVTSNRWRELPPLQNRVPPGLQGGTLSANIQIPADSSGRNLDGTLSLQNATYRARVRGAEKVVPVEYAQANFHEAGGHVTVPVFRLVSALFRTSGTATATQAAGPNAAWNLAGSGTLVAADAGQLVHWWSGKALLDGGKLTARYEVKGSSRDLADAALLARVELLDAQPLLKPGALPFDNRLAHVRALRGIFDTRGHVVHFRDVVWQASGFTVAGSGQSNGKVLDADVRLTTPDWYALVGANLRNFPLRGGTMVLTGHLAGPADRVREDRVDGRLTLRGAHLASTPSAKLPVQGGVVDLAVDTHGTAGHLVHSNVDGNFQVRKLELPALRTGASRVTIHTARGDFHRREGTVTLDHLVASTPGAHLTGSGQLNGFGTTNLRHSFHLAAEGPALASLLPAVLPTPGTVAGGKFSGTLSVEGTAKQRVTRLEAQATVSGLDWTGPGQKTPLHIERVGARVVRTGDRAVIDHAALTIPGGMAHLTAQYAGLGTPHSHHTFDLDWRLEDASSYAGRFLPIPGGFTGGLFTGKAVLTGTSASPFATANGSFAIDNAGYMPPKKVLGGPERPIQITHAGGEFTRGGGKTELQRLTLNSSLGTATGQITAVDHGNATIDGRAVIARLQDLIDLWPGFEDRIKGGNGEMQFALRGPLKTPTRWAGTIDITGRGGELTVQNVDPLYAVQPFDELSTHLTLNGGNGITLDSVKMRGPKANLDGKGTITSRGRVSVQGDAWFTAAFTKKLVKPRFLYSIAHVFGFKKLKSSYEVKGTLSQAKLSMGITHSFLWKTAIRSRVPEPLRDIATGEAPIWSSAKEASRVASK